MCMHVPKKYLNYINFFKTTLLFTLFTALRTKPKLFKIIQIRARGREAKQYLNKKL